MDNEPTIQDATDVIHALLAKKRDSIADAVRENRLDDVEDQGFIHAGLMSALAAVEKLGDKS